MAKKKRKKKAPGAAPSPQEQSERAARKEAAKREREKAIRAYRRRRLLVRGGIIVGSLAAVGAVGWLIWNSGQQAAERRAMADQVAAEVGCGEVEEPPNEGAGHVQQPPQYENNPPTSGPHFPQTLPAEVSVYEDPWDISFIFRAVHNLEHGYVIMYYQPEGENALQADVVEGLADLAESEPEVILAPYPGMPEGENLDLVSWNRIRRCSVDQVEVGDAQLVAETFIEEFRNGPEAPEAAAN